MTVITSKRAVQDLIDINSYYNIQKNGLGKEFIKEFRRTYNYIKKSPFYFSIKADELRFASVKKFPFTIIYKFVQSTDTIYILAVFHTSLNPDKWQNIY